MECKIKNKLGTISITEDVILAITGYSALECYGIVAMASKKKTDGIVERLGYENLSRGVRLHMNDEESVDIDLFIVVEYGVSIAEVANAIISTVRYKLEHMTGVRVRHINISVEGIRV